MTIQINPHGQRGNKRRVLFSEAPSDDLKWRLIEVGYTLFAWGSNLENADKAAYPFAVIVALPQGAAEVPGQPDGLQHLIEQHLGATVTSDLIPADTDAAALRRRVDERPEPIDPETAPDQASLPGNLEEPTATIPSDQIGGRLDRWEEALKGREALAAERETRLLNEARAAFRRDFEAGLQGFYDQSLGGLAEQNKQLLEMVVHLSRSVDSIAGSDGKEAEERIQKIKDEQERTFDEFHNTNAKLLADKQTLLNEVERLQNLETSWQTEREALNKQIVDLRAEKQRSERRPSAGNRKRHFGEDDYPNTLLQLLPVLIIEERALDYLMDLDTMRRHQLEGYLARLNSNHENCAKSSITVNDRPAFFDYECTLDQKDNLRIYWQRTDDGRVRVFSIAPKKVQEREIERIKKLLKSSKP